MDHKWPGLWHVLPHSVKLQPLQCSAVQCRPVQCILLQCSTHHWISATCLFTRLEESLLVPAGFLTTQFLQKVLFMKSFFWVYRLVILFTAFLKERGSIGKLEGWHMDMSLLFFSSLTHWRETSYLFSHQNKGFINYIFCRNWAGLHWDQAGLL